MATALAMLLFLPRGEDRDEGLLENSIMITSRSTSSSLSLEKLRLADASTRKYTWQDPSIAAWQRTHRQRIGDAFRVNYTVPAHTQRDGIPCCSRNSHGFRKPHTTYALTAEAEQIFPKAYGTVPTSCLFVCPRNSIASSGLKSGRLNASG